MFIEIFSLNILKQRVDQNITFRIMITLNHSFKVQHTKVNIFGCCNFCQAL